MTEKQRQQMLERKRAAYTRRLREQRDLHGMPALTNVQRQRVLDMLMRVEGDGVCDTDLRVIHRLASRGLCG
jgi:hypothetical protein